MICLVEHIGYEFLKWFYILLPLSPSSPNKALEASMSLSATCSVLQLSRTVIEKIVKADWGISVKGRIKYYYLLLRLLGSLVAYLSCTILSFIYDSKYKVHLQYIMKPIFKNKVLEGRKKEKESNPKKINFEKFSDKKKNSQQKKLAT